MKTNLFRVKEKKEEKIVIEEERTDNPFLLFLKSHKNFIVTSLILLGISSILVSIGLAFSLFQPSTEFDISFLNDTTEEVVSNTNPELDEDDYKEEILGEIGRTDGVVILVKTFMDSKNDVIYYFSDMTSIIIQADGKILRVSPNSKGKYGIDENGNIDSTSKTVQVKSTTTTLSDGTIITNYSDGTAKVEHKNVTIFVRDDTKIKLNSGNALKNVIPSGVAINTEQKQAENGILNTFTDKTKLVTDNNTKHIVNPNVNAEVNNNNTLTYNRYNAYGILEEKVLSDDNTVTYYENGSATIINKNGNTIYVKKSGDIIIKDNTVYEIKTNSYGFSKKIFNSSDGKKVTFFDNGAAIIQYPDGTKKYVEDSDNIIFDSNKNIISNPITSGQKSTKKTTDGYQVINFDNGKSEVLKGDGTSFIIDTNNLIFDTEGNITSNNKKDNNKDKDKEEDDNKEEGDSTSQGDPLEGMYVSESEIKYNQQKNIQYTNFLIQNTNNQKRTFRIVIEEIDDYSKYHATRLEPKYVKYQALIGNNFISDRRLDEDVWEHNGTNNYVANNYILYEGTIDPASVIEVTITLYVDYSELDNSKQDTYFIGTVKTYVVS